MIEDYNWKEKENGIIYALNKLDVGLEAQIELVPAPENDDKKSFIVSVAIYTDRQDRLEELYKASLFVVDQLNWGKMYSTDLIEEQSDFFDIFGECILIEAHGTCVLDAKRMADHFLIPYRESLGLPNEKRY